MGYSKAETEKKQRKLVSKTQRNTRKVLVIFFKVILVGIGRFVLTTEVIGYGLVGTLVVLAIVRTVIFYIMDKEGL